MTWQTEASASAFCNIPIQSPICLLKYSVNIEQIYVKELTFAEQGSEVNSSPGTNNNEIFVQHSQEYTELGVTTN